MQQLSNKNSAALWTRTDFAFVPLQARKNECGKDFPNNTIVSWSMNCVLYWLWNLLVSVNLKEEIEFEAHGQTHTPHWPLNEKVRGGYRSVRVVNTQSKRQSKTCRSHVASNVLSLAIRATQESGLNHKPSSRPNIPPHRSSRIMTPIWVSSATASANLQIISARFFML